MEPTKDYSIEGLTARIVEASKTISDCITQHGLPKLSFDLNAPQEFPVPPNFPAVHMARLALLEATRLLERLVQGPKDSIVLTAAQHHDTGSLRTLYRFNVFEAVPLEEEIAYANVAKKIGLDTDRTRRIMQYAMTNGVFKETRPGYVGHTASSAAVARDEEVRALVGHFVEEAYPSAARYTEWLEAHPVDVQEPTETGVQLAFGKKQNIFDLFAAEPERGRRFALAMSSLSRPGRPFDRAFVLQSFDWSSIGDATVVDVGGGRGHIMQAIAEAFPKLNFIIQDDEKTLKLGEEALPSNLKSRFEFMPHDFFNSEPDLCSRGKIVFYLRLILHDWSDKYCIKILRNLLPALKDGSVILINENVLPPIGSVNGSVEKISRFGDVQMMTLCNSRERSADEFEHLFTEADPRLKLKSIRHTPGSPLAMIEIRFSENA